LSGDAADGGRGADDGRVRIEARGDDVLIWIKAVPNASRDQVAGVVGDRLKVRVSAPPEGGKANKAIVCLLAKTLGVKASTVTVEQGASAPEKIARVADVNADDIRARLTR
jgi:uncharacterized protein (TIGR00251 family)